MNSTKHGGLIRRTLGATVVAMALIAAVAPAGAATGNGGAAQAAPAAESSGGKVDVNSANATELASLPGIGASKAAAIIAEREKKPFTSVEDMERVRGIGARTVEDLRGKVTVGGR